MIKNRKSTSGRATSMTQRMASVNRWREQFNPLRGLTLARAVAMWECYARGEMADLQWTYYNIEQADADLFTLVERRTSAMGELDWKISEMPKSKRLKDWDDKLAEDQGAALMEAYNRVENLTEAIEHLALATFRGYAHCEKIRDAVGLVTRLEPVDQWNVVRDGLNGGWKYNPEAQQIAYRGLPEAMIMPEENFVIRCVRRHVDRIGLIKYIRTSLAEKDWTAFLEIYGVPSGIVIMPPNIPIGKESEYEDAAGSVAEGGSGALPNGSDYKTNDQPRGTDPFRGFLDYFSEKLVMAATGGLLTVLTQSGSGTLAGGAHMEVFKLLARAEARRINEVLQRAIDREVLAANFPDKPMLAYWELSDAGEGEADKKEFQRKAWLGFMADGTVNDVLANQTDLKALTQEVGLPVNEEYTDPYLPVQTQAGGTVTGGVVKDSEGEVVGGEVGAGAVPNVQGPISNDQRNDQNPKSEIRNPKTGIDPQMTQISADGKDRLANRAMEGLMARAGDEFARAQAEALRPLRERIQAVLNAPEGERVQKLDLLRAELPDILREMNASPEAARVIEESLAAAWVNGREKSEG